MRPSDENRRDDLSSKAPNGSVELRLSILLLLDGLDPAKTDSGRSEKTCLLALMNGRKSCSISSLYLSGLVEQKMPDIFDFSPS